MWHGAAPPEGCWPRAVSLPVSAVTANALTAPVFLPPKSPISLTAYRNRPRKSVARNDGLGVSAATSGAERAPVDGSIFSV